MNGTSIWIPPELAGAVASMREETAGDAGYRNPDGNPVDAPAGTLFAELELSPAPGSLVRVEVALPPPERWDGRLVGIGNGGGGGWLPSKELGAHLRRGRATTTTDLGTKRDPARAGVGNREVWKDFGHRATHLAMVAGRALAAARYGREPRFAYFLGGSTGGRQGLMLAQRHPADADAVLSAVPANAMTALAAYFLWNWQALHRADGSRLFTDAQEKSWHAAALAEEGAIRLLCVDATLLDACDLTSEDFSSPMLGRLYGMLREKAKEHAALSPAVLSGSFSPEEVAQITTLRSRPEPADDPGRRKALADYIGIIRAERDKRTVEDLRADLDDVTLQNMIVSLPEGTNFGITEG